MKKLLMIATAVFLMAPVGLMANTLVPGATGVAPDLLTYSTNVLADTGIVNFTSNLGASDFSGVAEEIVVQGNSYCSSCLSFVFAFDSASTSTNTIESATASNFAGFLIDAGYSTQGGFGSPHVAPTTMSRSGSGQTIGFQFGSPITANEGSYALVIDTNATQWTAGHLSFINSGVATINAFAPTVPEPATVGLLALGLLALGAGTLLKRRQVSM